MEGDFQMQTKIQSHIREQLYEAFKNAIIQSPKYLDDEQLSREGQFDVLTEIFNANVRNREIGEITRHFAPVFQGGDIRSQSAQFVVFESELDLFSVFKSRKKKGSAGTGGAFLVRCRNFLPAYLFLRKYSMSLLVELSWLSSVSASSSGRMAEAKTLPS